MTRQIRVGCVVQILVLTYLKLTYGEDDGFGPTIDIFPPNDNTLEIGQDFTMRCRSSIEPDSETIWFRGKEEIDFSKEEHIRTNSFGDLIFVNPQPGDNDPTGEYTCSLKNQFGVTKLGYMLQVGLSYFEDKFRYTPRDNFFYDIEGSNLAWANCLPPHSHPKIVATYINGSSGLPANLEDERVTIRHLIRNGVYTQIIIQNATAADAGRWACVAKHRTLGEKRVYFNISFYGPPPAPTNLRVKQSRAQGFIMEWDYVRNDLAFYDITITKTSDRTVQNFQMKDSKSPQLRQFLTYEFTGLTQSTEYSIRMRATDEKGQVGAWSEPFVTTTVDKMPPLLIESPPVVMRVGEDRTIEIPCVIEGLPEPKFEWFRDGTQITESENVEIEGGILRLKAPKRGSEGSEGKYKCRGTNEFGSAESEETQLIVEWIDNKFQIAPRTRFFYATNNFLRVSARLPKGIEPINVQWRQARKLIVKKTHPLFSPTLYKGPTGKLFHALDIRTPTIVQSDVYHVSAFNLGGVVHKEFRLILAPPPLPIGIFNVTDQRHGSVSVRWKRPPTIVRLQKLGYFERVDIGQYELMYKKKSDPGNGTIVSLAGNKFEYTMTGLDIDVDYIARIRATDHGDQIGKWSLDLPFKLDKDLPPAIVEGPERLSQGKIGDTLTLTCKVSADKSVQIKWFRNEAEILRSEVGYEYLSDGGLKLSDIKRTMSGKYHCQASTQFGTTLSDKGEVKIVFLEREYQYTKEFVGIHNKVGFKDARILCIPPKSFPPAVVLWANTTGDKFLKRSNSRIEIDEAYLKDGVRYYSLLLKNAVDFVGQKYGCVVYNRVIGTDTFYNANTEIKIFGKPDAPVVRYRVSPTESLIVEWTSDREDITSFNIAAKNGNELVQSLITSEKTYEFKGLSKKVLYTFEVVAIDVASQKSDPGRITMSESKPTIRKDLPEKVPTVVEGKDITFECDFYGYPYPQVEWYRDDRKLSADNNFKLTEGNRKLTFVKTNHNVHNGKYQCEATNKAGTTKSREITVDVTYIDPKFKYKGKNIAFVNRDGKRAVSFACAPPDAYPPFNFEDNKHVHWLKDGKPLNNIRITKSRKLVDGIEADVIEFQAITSDIGTYTCAYPHPAGTKRHDMQLTVKDGARPPVNVKVKSVSYNFFTIQWDHAGDEITGYQLTVSHHSTVVREATTEKTATEYTFDNMSPTTSYDVSIMAVGEDTNSFPVTLMANTTARPIIGVPSIITNVQKINVGSTSATLTWDAPTELSNNHPDRLTYEIKICVGENTNCKLISPRVNKRTYTFTELHPVTIYKFFITVYAETATPGPVYEDILQTLNGGAPPAILNLEANPSWNTITLSWKAPHDTEIRRIQHYILRIESPTFTLKKREQKVSKDRTSYFFLDLEEGKEYTVSILAHNNGVDGPVNQMKVKTLDLGTPGRPTNLLIKKVEDPLDPSIISVTFEWGPPKELARNPIDEIKYAAKLCDFQEKCESSGIIPSRSYTFTKKTAGITYSYEIRTLRADEKPGSATTGEFNSNRDLISEVENLRKGVSENPDRSILLSWGMPQNLLGNSVNSIKFKVEYCRKRGSLKFSCTNTESSGTSIVLNNLLPATEYVVSIRASSPAGLLGVPASMTVATEGSIGVDTTLPPTRNPVTRPTQPTDTTRSSNGNNNKNINKNNIHNGNRENIVKESLSTGVIIGIVLAVIIILILISAGVVMYIRRQRSFQGAGKKKMPNNYIVEVEMNRRKQNTYNRNGGGY